MPISVRAALAVLLVLASGAAAAPAVAAPELSIRVAPSDGVVLGDEHEITGSLTDGPSGLANRVVTLDARPAGARAFRVLETATTSAEGEYAFARAFDRNQRLRVRAAGASAQAAAAFVFPDVRLSVRTVRRNVVRITQSFPATAGVPVLARSFFYLGRAGAETAGLAGRATVRRRGRRYLAQASVRVPVRYERRFSYGACLEARRGSALGDPDARCPRRSFRLP